MKKLLLLTSLLFSMQSHAAIVGVSGQGSIIAPVAVQEDSPTNTEQQGFDENQNVLLTSALNVDGGTIAAGTYVSSHLIFLNSAGNARIATEAQWTFDGNILGTMTDYSGNLLTNSNSLFAVGSYFTVGSSAPFSALGLEGSDDASYTGNQLELAMLVTEPGDWIRVITAGQAPSAVPLPASAFLFGPAVLGFIARRRVKA